MSRVDMYEQGGMDNRRRYHGMNPAFVKRVWKARREDAAERLRLAAAEAAEAAEDEDQPSVAAKAHAQMDEWELARIRRLRAQMDAGGTKAIIANAAAKHGLTVADLTGDRRTKKVVAARHEAILEVVKQRPSWSLTQIGRIFGKDHTTVLHVINKAAREASALATTGQPE